MRFLREKRVKREGVSNNLIFYVLSPPKKSRGVFSRSIPLSGLFFPKFYPDSGGGGFQISGPYPDYDIYLEKIIKPKKLTV